MCAMWRAHGKPGGPEPGLVARPYTLADARDRLAEVSGSRAFADEFFARYVDGREVVDYERLLHRAGFVFRKRGGAWMGLSGQGLDGNGTITSLVPWGSPAFNAGLDQGDVIVDVDGKPMAAGVLQNALERRKPGDRVSLTFKRRGGRTGTATVTLEEDPSLEAVPVESSGRTLTPDQRAFRDSWLGSKAGN
jgi:predicted metalloprotease with PDZ domain